MTEVTYRASDLAFDRNWIGGAALQVAGGLRAAGFDGYLVGGCVRDLLLHRRPKDFDVATNAKPQQVKALFNRARIVGKRFKIVHVRFGREVIEVATYRARPDNRADIESDKKSTTRQPKSAMPAISYRGQITDDNAFGTLPQDAARRDFTINALYYDPARELVLDYQNGVADARANTLRMIGVPRERFIEDPVRMLRAVRFRAKLGVTIDTEICAAISECRELLSAVPPARLYDETRKFFRHGYAYQGWTELCNHNLMPKLFPHTEKVLPNDSTTDSDNTFGKLIHAALKNTDARVRAGQAVIDAFLFAVLLWRPFQIELDKAGQPSVEKIWIIGDTIFRNQSNYIAIPRRVSGIAIEIWAMQFRLQARRPKTIRRLLYSKRFRAAYDFLVLRNEVGELDKLTNSADALPGKKLVKWWCDIQQIDDAAKAQRIAQLTYRNSTH